MVDTKTCTTCKITKPLECFSKNKNKKHGYQNKCKDCFRLYRNNNKEKLSLLEKEWREKNKEYVKDYMKDYMKKWISDNKEKYLESYNRNSRARYKNNPLIKLKRLIRTYISRGLNNRVRKDRSHEIVGCSWVDLKKHLEEQFKDGMTWENHGQYGWHVDHIIPLSSAKTDEEFYKLNHYTNLQPLWWNENIKKSNKVL
jgi:hypothetical protein